MQRTIFFPAKINLIAAALTLVSACASSSDPNSKVATLYTNSPTPQPAEIAAQNSAPTSSPTNEVAVVAPAASPSVAAAASPTIPPPADEPAPKTDSQNAIVVTASDSMVIPVVGVQPKDLQDTFTAARSGGRVHDAIDIMAAGGTPVVAAVNGKIVKFFDSERGGITIYQLSPDEKTVYYYAHLQKRRDNLREGDSVKQGDVIGYVGDTGNSGAGNYHLHFAIWTITDPKRFYDGTNINPYPLLKQAKTVGE